MGLLSNLLLPGRLRTGPTVLLPVKPKPDALLGAVQLADPGATPDGDELLAAGTRIHAPLELTADLLKKLSIQDEERLWAYRVVAERPLPMDYYDKYLAAGIAYRFGGWALCEGSADDPAEDAARLAAVYLPEMPDKDELAGLLRGLLRLPEPESGPESEAESDEPAPVAETDAEDSVDAESAAEDAPEGDESGAAEESAEVTDAGGLVEKDTGQTLVFTGADIQVTAGYVSRFPAVVAGLMPYATEVVRIAVRAIEDGGLVGDDYVLEPGRVALALGNALDGPVVDAWGFQIFEAADLLPARREEEAEPAKAEKAEEAEEAGPEKAEEGKGEKSDED